MNTNTPTTTRPPLETLACVNHRCELYGQTGQNNLIVRKTYGKDVIRYLRCQACGSEFSERKNTALWNTKIAEAKAIAVGEHLAEGCSLKGTARLVNVDPSTVRRLNQRVGEHGETFHHEHVQVVEVEMLEADERHGYAGMKGQPVWEAELIDPQSKFILSHVQGPRNEALIRRLLSDGASRLTNRHDLVLMTDGDANYASLFAEIFGQPYRPSRRGSRGRQPQLRFRIPRTLAHVQIIKRREGGRVTQVDVRYTHGSRKRVHQALDRLGYLTPNTSAIERRNGTARRMSAHQVRKSLAFSRRPDTKLALGWWGVTVYNWSRPHRTLRQPLMTPGVKKVPAPHARDGLGVGRSSLFRSRDSPLAGVSPWRLEIISCHHLNR
jgi:IS1 family transposase/transposase-like protein